MKKYMIEQKGRSMIEMLGVLAIVGVLSVAGIAGYSKAMAKYKINKVMDEVSTIAANTKTMFASSGLYNELAASGSDTALKVAYDLGILPEEMTKACVGLTTWADSCVVNGLGGGVALVGNTTGDDFSIVFNGLTKDACVALMTSDWGGASGFKKVASVVGTETTIGALTSIVAPTDNATAAFAAAETGCACTGSGCTVGWVFY